MKLYRELDGFQLENAADVCDIACTRLSLVQLDLRYVPDEQSFEGRTVLNTCKETPAHYKPPLAIMQMDSLSHTATEFEWDETDPYVWLD